MIRLELSNRKVSEERIAFLENEIGIKFPTLFVDLVKEHDGGYPTPSCFKYYNYSLESYFGNGVGAFLCLEKNEYGDLLSTYQDPPEFFPIGLVAFSQDGGGNYVCFDYRKGKDSLDPPVVYWSHESEEGKDVSFLANNFEEFLKILKTDEEMDELLK